MAQNIPAYVVKHAEALQRACAMVAKHAEAIEDWVDKQGEDGFEFATTILTACLSVCNSC